MIKNGYLLVSMPLEKRTRRNQREWIKVDDMFASVSSCSLFCRPAFSRPLSPSLTPPPPPSLFLLMLAAYWLGVPFPRFLLSIRDVPQISAYCLLVFIHYSHTLQGRGWLSSHTTGQQNSVTQSIFLLSFPLYLCVYTDLAHTVCVTQYESLLMCMGITLAGLYCSEGTEGCNMNPPSGRSYVAAILDLTPYSQNHGVGHMPLNSRTHKSLPWFLVCNYSFHPKHLWTKYYSCSHVVVVLFFKESFSIYHTFEYMILQKVG